MIKDFRISSNEKFICLRFWDKVIIYSIELKSLIVSLNKDNGIVLSLKLCYDIVKFILNYCFSLFR